MAEIQAPNSRKFGLLTNGEFGTKCQSFGLLLHGKFTFELMEISAQNVRAKLPKDGEESRSIFLEIWPQNVMVYSSKYGGD